MSTESKNVYIEAFVGPDQELGEAQEDLLVEVLEERLSFDVKVSCGTSCSCDCTSCTCIISW